MSDDLQISDYGKTSIERSQNWEPMPPAPRELEQAAEEKTAFDAGVKRLEALDQAAEAQPMEVGYKTTEGAPYPEKYSVEASRAAEDVSDWRRGQEDIQRALKDQALSDEIEKLRGTEPQSQPQTPAEPVALDRQVQPEPIPVPPGFDGADSDLVKAFRENPKLLEAMTAYSWQTDSRIAAAEQQAQARSAQVEAAAADFVHANAKTAIAGVFVRYPELQNLSQQELPLALNLLQRSNPERHAAIMHEIAGIQGLINESNRVARVQQEQAAHQYHQQFRTWSGEEDAKSTRAHPEMADNATASGVMQRTRSYVHQKGFSDDDIARAWNGQAHLSLRDARVQSMLYDAMRYREAVAAVPAARANKPAKVQVPGPAGMQASPVDYDLRDLSNKLTNATGRDAARLGAQMIAARRARSR
jgi:hypothetical protein